MYCISFFFSFLFEIYNLFPILENIALNKSAWQLYSYEGIIGDIRSASKAIDGLKTDMSISGQQCTLSAYSKYEAMLRVDLGAILGIHSITIYYRTDNVQWGKHTDLFCLKLILLLDINKRKDRQF